MIEVYSLPIHICEMKGKIVLYQMKCPKDEERTRIIEMNDSKFLNKLQNCH